MSSTTNPYWGELPAPQVKARRLSDDQPQTHDNRQSLDVGAQAQVRPNRASVQTTKSDAPTESTLSPFASPTASSFQGQGLAPRPPSLPYAANQYPPELVENRRKRRSRNLEQDEEYYAAALAAASSAAASGPPPAAPDVPRTAANYRYPPSSSGNRNMDVDDYYKAAGPEHHPVLDRAQKTLDESALPRSHRSNGQPRRTSAAEQNLQRSTRRTSTQDRSRIISKEDKRARLEAAERAARNRTGGTTYDADNITQSARRPRRTSLTAGDTPGTPGTPGTPSRPTTQRATPGQNGPLSQNPPEDGQPFSAPTDRSPRGQASDSQAASPGQSSGIPQRNLSFRERAAKSDIKLPNDVGDVAPKETLPVTSPPKSGSNKLKKNRANPNDTWPRRVSVSESEVEEARKPLEGSHSNTQTIHVVPTTPVTPRFPGEPVRLNGTGTGSVRSSSHGRRDSMAADREFYEDEMYPPRPAKLQKTPSQRKADQILGRVPPNTVAANGAQQVGAISRDQVSPAAPVAPAPAVDNASQSAHRSARRDNRSDSESDDEGGHHVSNLVYHGRDRYVPGDGLYQPTPYLDEWQKGTVGALTGALLDLEDVPPSTAEKGGAGNGTWWESPKSRTRASSLSSRPKKAEAFEGEYDDTNGTQTPTSSAFYPNISAVQSGDLSRLSEGEVGRRLTSKNQDLKKKGNRGRRWEGLRPFSPSPADLAAALTLNDSRDSLDCFSICSDAFSGKAAVSYSTPTRFKPPLYLKCGPLLRYCGIRHERVPSRSTRGASVDREIWRGSIMIVTTDKDSSYDIAPTLRLFVQPIELLPLPPKQVPGDEPLAAEYVDPIAGHPKLGRKGETLYVRPVDHLEPGRDVSRDETDDGLFEKTRSPPEGPLPGGSADPPGSFAARRKRAEMDGEKAGKYKDVRGFRLHAEHGYTFWRFNVEIELRDKQQRIAYRINRGPSTGFWVPAKGQTMNIMFHSCNGFSMSVNPDEFTGPDPMWRDVLNAHQSQPFHVMIGGGDQIYNDRCMQDTTLFRNWLMIKNPIQKHNAPFSSELQLELERYYMERYAMWFSQGLFSMANSQIPMVNMYDDHDIIDGFGSYPHHFMNSPVFSGLGNVAFKYYMLFQHQSIPAETERHEPSWTLGVKPGPYINELSRSLFMFLGSKVALLAVDARTERTRQDVINEDTWKKIMDRCYQEIDKGKVEHLLVLLGVPIAYPRLVWLENILTSRVMDPIKALSKMGMFKGLLNRFDGGVEVLDDLDDHWTAKSHKAERKFVIEDLQDLAADKSIRITILSGDVHLAAIGQFYSNPKLGLAKHKDFRYMPNVISSAIVNTPPPDLLADVLNKRNKVHHFDKETDEDMIPIFGHGVDSKPRNNKHLLPHRNWCAIRPYVPGHTPEPTPTQSAYDLTPDGSPSPAAPRPGLLRRLSGKARASSFRGPDSVVKDRSRPPISNSFLRGLSSRGGVASADEIGRPGTARSNKLTRTMSGSSVSGRLGGLFRRLSSSSKKPRDDGGINGNWGADTDEDAIYDDETLRQRVGAHPSGGVGLRGGLGDYPSGYSTQSHNSEYARGDESYFTVKPPQPVQSHQQPPPYQQHNPNHGRSKSATVVGSAAQYPSSATSGYASASQQHHNEFVPKPFSRIPTGLSAKQLKHAKELEVDLEGGLEVTLNVEIAPKDPSGSTVPYRLVVPRLWYEYEGEEPEDEEEERKVERGVRRGGQSDHGQQQQGGALAEGGQGPVFEKKPGGLKRLFSGRRRKSVSEEEMGTPV
ncbi:uncharacterized protein PODANS_1_1940 [Podospora anserina S mat+]|uniref:Podospora anserina S mat+ genomic DNA chromosome 1, supercontig 1 n=1 Tax=Podospora anserina (strain S / ATCC MYA-4624 / DSM 980 / FGSC 10383) TaxID=515849 RepID=B2A9V7_PODAN|nr:uncharacterized protein PODANS_1_1940 [Podospora anserina S mat+]CAP59867.1 unnamed protein product [Podospora anserina S mat+]CDP22510.1 Putative protein of unknown function [Podospora anserina S mat+]